MANIYLTLLRMVLSLIGVANSNRCMAFHQKILKEMRITLKKFLLVPKSAPNQIVEMMINYGEIKTEKLVEWEKVAKIRLGGIVETSSNLHNMIGKRRRTVKKI